MNFGDKIRVLREEKNLTQDDLAKQLNLSKANISRYEIGSRQPSIETIVKISEFFNVSLDWLFGRSIIKHFTYVNNTPRNFDTNDLVILEYIKNNTQVFEMLKELRIAPEIRVQILTKIWNDINIELK